VIKKKKHNEDALQRALLRLLQSLEESGARCMRSDVDDTMFVVAAPRNGVTIVRASIPANAIELALTRGLLRKSELRPSKEAELTQEGRSYLRRALDRSGAEPFRAQHSPIEVRALTKGAAPVLCNEGESPLAWLARRKDRAGTPFLSPALVEAGERFRRDATQAQLLQRVTANWEAALTSERHGAGRTPISDIALDARSRLSRACDSVGPDLAGLLIDVCGYLKGLEIVENERGWPRRSGKVVLKIALDRLSRHYGLASEARGPRNAPGLRQWGADDYRPRLSGAEPSGASDRGS
jgi:hypothetical protein